MENSHLNRLEKIMALSNLKVWETLIKYLHFSWGHPSQRNGVLQSEGNKKRLKFFLSN